MTDALFSFLYLKKSKFQKYMSVLKYFKTTPGRPMGATRPRCNFFLQICNEVPGRKKIKGGHVAAPPNGRQGGLSPPSLGRPVGPAHRRNRGACRRHPRATGLYKHSTPIPSSFEPKNSTKNSEKKRGVRRREAAKPYRIPHL